MQTTTLHFFCGKAGAGKSTTAAQLAAQTGALLLSEDVWLSRLYGDQIKIFDDYIRFSQKLNTVVTPPGSRSPALRGKRSNGLSGQHDNTAYLVSLDV